VTAASRLDLSLRLARLCLDLGAVSRATRHPDGVTPESDTTHTVMLTAIACSLADDFGLDAGKVAQLATVHDIVEAHTGDVDTLGITPEARAAKERAEAAAAAVLHREFAGTWLSSTLAEYDAQQSPEARFVRYLDKLMPRLTHTLNGGTSVKLDLQALRCTREVQMAALARAYPEFGAVADLILAASLRLECVLAAAS